LTGFLSAGDKIALGKAELAFEQEPAVHAAAAREPTPIDPDAWIVLEQLTHPSVAQALIRFLEAESRPGWIEAGATRLFDDPKRAQAVVERVKKRYAEHTKIARDVLPKWLGKCVAPQNPMAWLALFRAKEKDLPPQVMPAGWFPPREGDPKSSPAVDILKSDPALELRLPDLGETTD
jgi:hypothetical protein